LGGRAIAERRPQVSAESRGMVVNGDFDVLLDALGGTS
jgi:hypothetical protein